MFFILLFFLLCYVVRTSSVRSQAFRIRTGSWSAPIGTSACSTTGSCAKHRSFCSPRRRSGSRCSRAARAVRALRAASTTCGAFSSRSRLARAPAPALTVALATDPVALTRVMARALSPRSRATCSSPPPLSTSSCSCSSASQSPTSRCTLQTNSTYTLETILARVQSLSVPPNCFHALTDPRN